MVAVRAGSLGVIESKGDILAFDGSDLARFPIGTNGQYLAVDTAQPYNLKWTTLAVSGSPRSMIFMGGSSMAGGDTTKHFNAQDTSVGGKVVALSSANQMACGIAGTANLLTWSSATATATTVFRIKKNGVVAATVTLTGASGAVAVSFSVALGDLIAVEYNSGAAPGATTVQVWAA